MVQLAPDASPLSRCLQPKKKKNYAYISSACLAWPPLYSHSHQKGDRFKTDETESFFVSKAI